MRGCDITARVCRGMTHVAAGHPDARQDAAADEVFPRQPADRFDHLAGHEIQHVVVRVGAAEAGGGLDESEAPGDLFAIVGRSRPPEQIAGAQAEAATVYEQIANRQLARDVRVPHLERGQVADDGRVPLDFAFFHQEPQRGGREELRVGRDPEERPRIDRRRIPKLLDTVPLRHHGLAVLDDRQREPGHLERFHRPCDVGVEVGGRGRQFGLSGAERRRQDRDENNEKRRGAMTRARSAGASGSAHSRILYAAPVARGFSRASEDAALKRRATGVSDG